MCLWIMEASYIEKMVQKEDKLDLIIEGRVYTLPYDKTETMMRLGRIRFNDAIFYETKDGKLTTLAIKLSL